MRTLLWCLCIGAVLGVSAVTSADIESEGGHSEETYPPDNSGGGYSSGGTTEHSTTANADGDEPYTWGYGEGWDFIYTTETARCAWQYDGYVYADAEGYIYYDEWAAAYGYGDIYGNGASSDGLSGDALIDEDGPGTPTWKYVNDWFLRPEERNRIHDAGYYEFGPGQGVYCSHTATALAEVPEDGYSWSRAHGDAWARGLLAPQ